MSACSIPSGHDPAGCPFPCIERPRRLPNRSRAGSGQSLGVSSADSTRPRHSSVTHARSCGCTSPRGAATGGRCGSRRGAAACPNPSRDALRPPTACAARVFPRPIMPSVGRSPPDDGPSWKGAGASRSCGDPDRRSARTYGSVPHSSPPVPSTGPA